MFTTNEGLLKYFTAGYIHLSKKDYNFFSNLDNIITDKKVITSNQSKLFNKLVFKYKRQLTKEGHNVEELAKLDWQSFVITSEPEFLRAKISIKNNKIEIRSPFNSKFITAVKSIDLQPYIWNKEKKCYTGDFSTYNLQNGVNCVNKFYNDVDYDTTVSNLLDNLKHYQDTKYWNPTLVKLDNSFYILGINESLFEVVKNFELSDDPITLLHLSQYGISIDDSVIQGNDLLHFASHFYTHVDIDNIKDLSYWISILNFDLIFLGSSTIYNKSITEDIKLKLGQIPISRSVQDLDLYNNILYLNYNSYKRYSSSSILHSGKEIVHKKITKVVTLTNSRPICVK
jgi:hypothetical protein